MLARVVVGNEERCGEWKKRLDRRTVVAVVVVAVVAVEGEQQILWQCWVQGWWVLVV